MQTTQGSLVIIGANTATPQVFFDGEQIAGITGINIDCDAQRQKVVLTVAETGALAALKAAGVQIKREA